MKPPALIIGIGGKGPPVGPAPPGSMGQEPDGDEGQQGDGKLYVPLASLQTPDQGDKMQTPEVGDTGSMQVDYTVESIEGDQACIKPTGINGNPLPNPDETDTGTEDQTDNPEGETPETSAMGDELRGQAQAMSQQ